MTEAQWLASTDPAAMLYTVQCKRSVRKSLLFACACCRRVWGLLKDQRSRSAVEMTERFVDESASREEYRAACRLAIKLVGGRGMGPVLVPLTGAARYAAIACGWLGDHPIEDIAGMVRKAEVEDAQEQEMADHSKAQWALNVILRENWRAGYVRDIFGNPFRPVAFSPEWRTDTALTLARQMYEAREFGAMPILADALQDAGCDNPDILDHCRGPGPHVRGCWVVDLVLGLS